jgi:hypothetical protein
LFDRIKIAEINKNPKQLLKYGSENTYTYFENIKELTLNADSLEVRDLNIFSKIMILYFRGSLAKDELANTRPEDLFVHYFDNTVILKSAIEDRVLRAVYVYGNDAFADLNSQTLPYPISHKIKFHKEHGIWKYDFPTYFEINNKNLEEIRSMSNDSEDEYLIAVLNNKGVHISYNKLWKPIVLLNQ